MRNRLLFWLTPPTATVIVTRRDDAVATLRVELARNIWRRARGLMGRTNLPEDGGMLFVYPWPRVVRIWMARVPLALDVVFIDQRRTVVKIAHDLAPSSARWISSGVAVNRVLEVAAGVSARTGIAVGDSVSVGMDAAARRQPERAELQHLIGRTP